MTDSTNDPVNENDDILAGALGRLPRETAPPAALEDATVASLRSAGLLRPAPMAQAIPQAKASSGLNLATWVLAASIAAIAFVGGSVYLSTRPQPATPLFALTVYTAESSEDSATRVNHSDELERWAMSVNATERGTARPAVDYDSDSIIVEEEPYRNKQIVRTYYIAVPSKDSAVSVAKNCPWVKYGARVVVQAVLDKAP